MNKRRVIYYSDARHYHMYIYDPPIRLEEAYAPVDEAAGTSANTFAYGFGVGPTMFHGTEVGEIWGSRFDEIGDVASWRARENVKSLLGRGLDPLDEGRRESHDAGGGRRRRRTPRSRAMGRRRRSRRRHSACGTPREEAGARMPCPPLPSVAHPRVLLALLRTPLACFRCKRRRRRQLACTRSTRWSRKTAPRRGRKWRFASSASLCTSRASRGTRRSRKR